MMTNYEFFDTKDDPESNRDLLYRENRLYVVSPYYADSDGKLIAELPDLGPCHNWDQRPCNLGIDHYRDRKTGPCFPILVIHCSTHNKGFTVYPPGYTPYGRCSLAPVGPDGELITEKRDAQRFRGTYFDAALDAANHCFWPCESTLNSLTARFCTQKRHLSRAGLLLGIQAGLHQRLREEMAQILAVPAQRLHDSAALMAAHPDCQNQGQAICMVLDSLQSSSCVFDRLADAGAQVCLWAPFNRWDSKLKTFRLSAYRSMRTRASPR
jgi:hypothetical protein